MSNHPAKSVPPPLPHRRRAMTESGIEWHDATLLEDDLTDEPSHERLVAVRTPPPLRRSGPLPLPSAPRLPPMPASVASLPAVRGPLPHVVAPPPRTFPLPSPIPPPPRSGASSMPPPPMARVVPLPARPASVLPPPPRSSSMTPRPMARVLPLPARPGVPSARPGVLPPPPAAVLPPPPARSWKPLPPIVAARAIVALAPPSARPPSAALPPVQSVILAVEPPRARRRPVNAVESETFQVLAPSAARADLERLARIGLRLLAAAVRPWLTRRNGILGGALLVALVTLIVLTRPDTGRLRVNVGPYHGPRVDRAEVFVDGRKHCEVVPCLIEDLPAGPKMIRVVATNIVTPDVVLGTVEAGREATVIVPAYALQSRDARASK